MLVTLERRKTDRVDLQKPLQKYIKSVYSDQAVSDHQEHLNALQQLREDVRSTSTSTPTESTRDLHLKYTALLRSLELRFPISESNIRISFPWSDSLRNSSSRKTSLYSVPFERSSVLFNLSGVLSHLGASVNRQNPDGPKQAVTYFGQSAGVLLQIAEYVGSHPECSQHVDLAQESLKGMSEIMLGNAQYCFYEKASKSSMSKGVLSKLAAQAASYYAEGLKMMFSVPGMHEKMDKAWVAHVEVLESLTMAEAAMCAAEELEKEMKMGERVSRLAQAASLADEARKKMSKFGVNSAELRSYADSVASAAAQAHAKAIKENDTVYHEDVRNPSTLPPIAGKSMAKAAPPTELTDVAAMQASDPFSRLVPFAVRQGGLAYQERKEAMVRVETAAADEANGVLKASLASMGLPGAIEALDTPEGVPPALLEKAKAVRTEGGCSSVEELRETLGTMSRADGEILASAQKALDDEEREDNELRSQHGAKWTRTPSHALTSGLRQELAKNRNNSEHAAKSDALVASKWSQVSSQIQQLSQSEAQLVAMLPRCRPASSQQQGSAAVAAVKQGLSALDSLVSEREKKRAELQGLVARDDISPALMNATEPQFEAIFAGELRKYDPIVQSLRDGTSRQSQIIAKLQQDNAAFVQETKGSGSAEKNAREATLQSLAGAYTVYQEVKANLREGITFYTNFQEVLTRFKTKCDDFVLARRTEKEDLLSQLRSLPAGMSAPIGKPQPSGSLYGTSQQQVSPPPQASAPAYQQQHSKPLPQPPMQSPPMQHAQQPPPQQPQMPAQYPYYAQPPQPQYAYGAVPPPGYGQPIGMPPGAPQPYPGACYGAPPPPLNYGVPPPAPQYGQVPYGAQQPYPPGYGAPYGQR